MATAARVSAAALASFRSGRYEVLVATDVAARGIHVDAVPLVVHFDPPADATDYIHRSGRTGRAGADGSVVSLVGTHQLASSRKMQRELPASRPEVVPPEVQPRALDSQPARSTSPGATSETVSSIRSRRPRGTTHSVSGTKRARTKSSATAAANATAKPSPRPNGAVFQAEDGRSTDQAKRVSRGVRQNRQGSRPSSRRRRPGPSSGARRKTTR